MGSLPGITARFECLRERANSNRTLLRHGDDAWFGVVSGPWLHVLRHFCDCIGTSNGASPNALQTILGHGSAAFTLTVYGHLFDADLDDLAAGLESPAGPSRDALVVPRGDARASDA